MASWRERIFSQPAPDGWTPTRGEVVVMPAKRGTVGYLVSTGKVVAVSPPFVKVEASHGGRRPRSDWEISEIRPWPVKPLPKEERAPLKREPVTDIERRAIRITAGVVFPPATWAKRFCRDLRSMLDVCEHQHATPKLTEKQREALWKTVHRFRRQIADADVLVAAEAFLSPSPAAGYDPNRDPFCPHRGHVGKPAWLVELVTGKAPAPERGHG